jgi:hypothetical protein
MTKITIDICDEFYEFAKARAEDFDIPGPADYLLGLLNMAVLTDMDDYEETIDRLPKPLILRTTQERRLADKIRDAAKDKGIAPANGKSPHRPFKQYKPDHDFRNELEEDPGGGVWKKGDLDDDIPF